jgi:hypothetical protein
MSGLLRKISSARITLACCCRHGVIYLLCIFNCGIHFWFDLDWSSRTDYFFYIRVLGRLVFSSIQGSGKAIIYFSRLFNIDRSLAAIKNCTIISFVALAVCFGFWAKTYWEIYSFTGWKEQVFTFATESGSRQALSDFQKGKLQLYELNGEREKSEFSGRHDGQFEIWYKWYYPTLGAASRYGDAEYVEYYNDKMKYMYAHPEKFRQESNAVTNILAKPSAH